MPTVRDIISVRMARQRLTRGQLETPDQVVSWLGAVQAQDYPGAKWALGLRTRGASERSVERAFDEGRMLRTHVMRPTWHFVSPEDIRWMLELTSSRVVLRSANTHRRARLDKAAFAKSNAVIAKALEGRRHLTRAEIGERLAGAGVHARDVRLAYLVMQAELDGVICSGPRRGKQFTYALMDERAPRARRLERDGALRELVVRYFTGHGPATIKDFVWWSGLKVEDAKAGLEEADSLASELVDGKTYWRSASQARAPRDDRAFLLPTYDELFIGYSSFDESRRGSAGGRRLIFAPPVVAGAEVVGTWRRRLERERVVVEVAPFSRLSGTVAEEIRAAAERYGRFLAMDEVCEIRAPVS